MCMVPSNLGLVLPKYVVFQIRDLDGIVVQL